MNTDLIVKIVQGGKASESEVAQELTPLQIALARGEQPPQKAMEDELYEICDRVHASCDSECPVYALNNGPLNAHKPFAENRGCDCFKNGASMFRFIKSQA